MGFMHESCFLLPSIAILLSILSLFPFWPKPREVRDLARKSSRLMQQRALTVKEVMAGLGLWWRRIEIQEAMYSFRWKGGLGAGGGVM